MLNKETYSDDKGNSSTMRVAFLFIIGISILILFICAIAIVLEMFKETPDYTGISTIIGVVIASDGVAFIAKAYQKKHE